jgi:glutamate dehydrogenase/leucine dehydrogenase
MAEKFKTTYRMGAYMVAIERIVKARNLKGYFIG